MKRYRPVLAAGLAAACLAAPAIAQNVGYFNRYTGSWSGGGMIRLEKFSSPFHVSCKTRGKPVSNNGFSLDGHCTAMLIMSKNIAARLQRDKKGIYTGVYTGSSSGPAKLRGRLKGDTLVLDVTWGRVIYGDNVARMLISNSGDGDFKLRVVEKIKGKPVTVSDLDFRKA